ncbi:MAG: hypothetical protein NC184_02350 [Roseburia sp.]|nr:hypothetical protein [Roseburia sp.]
MSKEDKISGKDKIIIVAASVVAACAVVFSILGIVFCCAHMPMRKVGFGNVEVGRYVAVSSSDCERVFGADVVFEIGEKTAEELDGRETLLFLSPSRTVKVMSGGSELSARLTGTAEPTAFYMTVYRDGDEPLDIYGTILGSEITVRRASGGTASVVFEREEV